MGGYMMAVIPRHAARPRQGASRAPTRSRRHLGTGGSLGAGSGWLPALVRRASWPAAWAVQSPPSPAGSAQWDRRQVGILVDAGGLPDRPGRSRA